MLPRVGNVGGTSAVMSFDPSRLLGVATLDREATTSGSATLAVAPESPADAVRRTKDQSGLTWLEVATLFGVSRRAVHMWANGSVMTPQHINVLNKFKRHLDGRRDQTPEANRAWLLQRGNPLFYNLQFTDRPRLRDDGQPAMPLLNVRSALSEPA
jgi:transcriptional regulator with XRE-family HTH domain